MDARAQTGIKRLYESELGQTWLIHSETCQECAKGDFCDEGMTILAILGQVEL
jgi:hypothetical protein